MANDVDTSSGEGRRREPASTRHGNHQDDDERGGDERGGDERGGDERGGDERGGDEHGGEAQRGARTGGCSLVGTVVGWVASSSATAWLVRHRHVAFDIGAVVVAGLEVVLDPPASAHPYNYVLSAVASLALAWRRRYPLLVTLVTFPGWLTGWAQIAAMIALYTLAKSRPPGWQLVLGTALVWMGRYVQWPLDKTLAFSASRHIVRLIEGGMVSGLPVALGLLMTTRKDLSQRITELAASRERERRLHAQAVRTEERARLAREMHDLVSHQVTLIAMQAGALQVAGTEPDSRRIAATIRQLSTRTLDELRQLVGLLRATEDPPQPGLDELDDLVRGCGVDVTLAIDVTSRALPPAVSNAVYRTVQEALTNIGRHASGAATTVRITEEADDLRVAVHNERPSQQRPPTVPSGRHGLTGLRERATLLGGTFHAGPTPDGGFAIKATFPLAHTPALRAADDPVERPQDDGPG